uniref:ATP-dependent (S)-NAD(P)H-hydrate dehydratase n=1 Tax=Petromyzon marinus TaxID=7757 RepID=S4RJ02_PETMA
GKVGVMGGSKEYTGAPFYVGAASLRSGADIVHVFCPEEASIPIKSYSPELIVHPILTDEKETIKWLDACTSISIGSGLGRDPKLADTLAEIIEGVSKTNLSLICDADILWYMYKSNVKEQLNRAVMTPNVVEFQRMFEDIGEFDIDNLNNAIILKKGIVDLVSDGKGSLKRCGGQGDILSGILGTFVNYADNLKKSSEYSDLEENERKLLAVVSASSLNRMIAMNAYE